MKMKSRFFTVFDPNTEANKGFRTHLEQALALDEQQISACLKAFPGIRLGRSDLEIDQHLTTLSEITGPTNIELQQVMGVFAFLVDKMLKDEYKDDDPGHWADDLAQLIKLNQEDKEAFRLIANRLKTEVVPLIEDPILARSYGTGVLPKLSSCGTTVELRAVQKDEYQHGALIEEYQAKVIDTVGIISTHIGLDAGTPKDFYFQMTIEDLDFLIDRLTAAKKDLQALVDFTSTNTT